MHITSSIRTALVVGAGAVLAFGVSAPAFATDGSVTIRQTLPITAADFTHGDCGADWTTSQDYWHFVVPQGTFQELLVTFKVNGVEQPEQDITTFTHQDKMADVYTPAGAVLIKATANIQGDNVFNLSHTCAGTPVTTSGSPSASGSASASASSTMAGAESSSAAAAAASSSAAASSGSGGSLASTGADIGIPLAACLVLVGAGGVLVARRRKAARHQ